MARGGSPSRSPGFRTGTVVTAPSGRRIRIPKWRRGSSRKTRHLLSLARAPALALRAVLHVDPELLELPAELVRTFPEGGVLRRLRALPDVVALLEERALFVRELRRLGREHAE